MLLRCAVQGFYGRPQVACQVACRLPTANSPAPVSCCGLLTVCLRLHLPRYRSFEGEEGEEDEDEDEEGAGAGEGQAAGGQAQPPECKQQ